VIHKHGELELSGEDPYPFHVIAVPVRNEDTGDRSRIYSNRVKALGDLFSGKSRVDEERRSVALEKK
jgi:hypothetical protein